MVFSNFKDTLDFTSCSILIDIANYILVNTLATMDIGFPFEKGKSKILIREYIKESKDHLGFIRF